MTHKRAEEIAYAYLGGVWTAAFMLYARKDEKIEDKDVQFLEKTAKRLIEDILGKK